MADKEPQWWEPYIDSRGTEWRYCPGLGLIPMGIKHLHIEDLSGDYLNRGEKESPDG